MAFFAARPGYHAHSHMLKTQLLVFSLVCGLLQCMDTPRPKGKKVFLLFGPTRAGKSTFINKLYGGEAVGVGDLNGSQSTTMYCREVPIQRPDFFNDQRVSIIDVQGIDDTRLTQDEEIIDNIREFLMNVLMTNGVAKLDGIILFNSLRTNANVGRMIAYLEEMFTPEVTKSIFVLATKADQMRSNPAMVQTKIQAIQLMCESKSVPWRIWNNYDGTQRGPNGLKNIELSEDELNRNIVDLHHALADLPAYDLSGIQEALDQIETEALEMFRNQQWNRVVQEVEVENDILQEYLEEVDRTRYVPENGAARTQEELAIRAAEIQATVGKVATSELTTITVPREVVYHEVVQRMVPVTYRKRRGGLAGLCGGTKSCTDWVKTDVIETRTRMEDTDMQILKPVMKLLDLNQCMYMAMQETTFREESYKEQESKVRVAKDKTKVPITIEVPENSLEACRRNAVKKRKEELRKENSFHTLFSRRQQNGSQ